MLFKYITRHLPHTAANVAVVLAWSCMGFQVAHAASFNCAKARSTPEKLICNDSSLSAMDDDLAALYKKAKSAAKDQAAFQKQTKQEWERRERDCTDKACLLDWYENRRTQLTELIEKSSTAQSASTSTVGANPNRSPANSAPANPSPLKRSVENGIPIIMSPKVRPDGLDYQVRGYIQKSDGDQFFASIYPSYAEVPPAYIKYYVVLIPMNLREKYLGIARIDGSITINGAYVDNRELQLVSGASVVAPVFYMKAVVGD